MQTQQHRQHIESRVAYNNCPECRADCERSFLRPAWPGYQHVSEYLEYARPRLAAIATGDNSVNARVWLRDFRRALNRRITLKAGGETGRKRCDSYRDRLRQFGRGTDAEYLRRFASKGASTL